MFWQERKAEDFLGDWKRPEAASSGNHSPEIWCQRGVSTNVRTSPDSIFPGGHGDIQDGMKSGKLPTASRAGLLLFPKGKL